MVSLTLIYPDWLHVVFEFDFHIEWQLMGA